MNNLLGHAPVTGLSVRDGREGNEIKGRLLLLITGCNDNLVSQIANPSPTRFPRVRDIPFPSRESRYSQLLFAGFSRGNARDVELFSSIAFPHFRITKDCYSLFGGDTLAFALGMRGYMYTLAKFASGRNRRRSDRHWSSRKISRVVIYTSRDFRFLSSNFVVPRVEISTCPQFR